MRRRWRARDLCGHRRPAAALADAALLSPLLRVPAAPAHRMKATTPVEVTPTGRAGVHREHRDVIRPPFRGMLGSDLPAAPALRVLPRRRRPRFARLGIDERGAVAAMDLDRASHNRDSTPASSP